MGKGIPNEQNGPKRPMFMQPVAVLELPAQTWKFKLGTPPDRQRYPKRTKWSKTVYFHAARGYFRAACPNLKIQARRTFRMGKGIPNGQNGPKRPVFMQPGAVLELPAQTWQRVPENPRESQRAPKSHRLLQRGPERSRIHYDTIACSDMFLKKWFHNFNQHNHLHNSH